MSNFYICDLCMWWYGECNNSDCPVTTEKQINDCYYFQRQDDDNDD